MAFEGGVFHSKLKNGRSSATLEITSSAISVASGIHGSEYSLPLQELQIKLGGNQKLVLFSHPAFDDLSFYTSDKSVLNDPNLRALPALAKQIQSLTAQRLKIPMELGILALVLVAIGWALFQFKDFAADKIVERVPPQWETSLGQTMIKPMKMTGTFIKDGIILADLQKLIGELDLGIPQHPYQFEFHIMQEDSINAFAIPGGQVVFHTGLLLKAEAPEEILGVLAHEMAHVLERHSLSLMVSGVGTYALIAALFGDVGGLAGVIVDNSSFLLSRKFSRDHETDADLHGWKYLVKSGVDPRGMIRFFERLQEEHKLLKDVEGSLNFLSTHPATGERIAELKHRFEQDHQGVKWRQIVFDLKGFQSKLKEFMDAANGKNEGDGK